MENRVDDGKTVRYGFWRWFLGLLIVYGMAVYRPLTLLMNNIDNVLPLPFVVTAGAYFLWVAAFYSIYFLASRRILVAIILSFATHLLLVYYIPVCDFCASLIARESFGILFAIAILLLLAAGLLSRRLPVKLNRKTQTQLLVFLTVCMYGMLGALVIVNLPEQDTVMPDRPVKSDVEPVNEEPAQRPNVYFLLMDEYENFDMVQKHYGFDNSAFMELLENNGFQISFSSHNEIAFTDVLASNMLALNYVAFPESFGYDKNGYVRVDSDSVPSLYHSRTEYRNHSFLFDLLRSNGYKTYAIDDTNQIYAWGTVNADETVTISATNDANPLLSIALTQNDLDYWLRLWQPSFLYQINGTYTGMESILTNLYNASQDIAWKNTIRSADIIAGSFEYLAAYQPPEDSSVFVYAHLLCPHLPFIFYPDGTLKTMEQTFMGWDGENAYQDNYKYATRQMTQIIEHLRKADPEAVIVLQSDHGARPNLQTRGALVPDYLPILNAVYLPEWYDVDIEGLSGVNTMRAVLSAVLQIDLPQLEAPVYTKVE